MQMPSFLQLSAQDGEDGNLIMQLCSVGVEQSTLQGMVGRTVQEAERTGGIRLGELLPTGILKSLYLLPGVQ